MNFMAVAFIAFVFIDMWTGALQGMWPVCGDVRSSIRRGHICWITYVVVLPVITARIVMIWALVKAL